MWWKEGEAELTWAGILALAHIGHFCVLCDFDLPSCDIRMALLFRAGVVAAGSSVLLFLFPEVQVVPGSGWGERTPTEPRPQGLNDQSGPECQLSECFFCPSFPEKALGVSAYLCILPIGPAERP